MIVADSGALYALYDSSDPAHEAAADVYRASKSPFVVPGAVLSEVSYLLLENLGPDAELAFVDGLRQGALALEPTRLADLDRARELLVKYRDLRLGLADALVIATAERLGTRRIFTLDLRDFRAVTADDGGAFELLPADR